MLDIIFMYPSLWPALREFLSVADIQKFLITDLNAQLHIGWFESVFWTGGPFLQEIRQEVMVETAPKILLQHLGAGGHEDALWMTLCKHLDKKSLPTCFLTNKGDAAVMWEVRKCKNTVFYNEKYKFSDSENFGFLTQIFFFRRIF